MNRKNYVRFPVKRQKAEHYLLLTLLSFAASVSITRIFLQLTGYPQLGGRGLHIAHVLWGGLFLFISALLPLILANRWALTISAIFAGVGIGLFIDEVGKFITQNNDYFYPPAAPIIYAFFLITVLVYLQVRRPVKQDPRTELYSALDSFEDVLDQDLDTQERDELEKRLLSITSQANQYPELASLAKELIEFLHSQHISVLPDQLTCFERILYRIKDLFTHHVNRNKLRVVIVLGLGITGFIAAANLLTLVVKSIGPDSFQQEMKDLAMESSVSSKTAPYWFFIRLFLESITGISLLAASILIIMKQVNRGMILGYYGLLLSLTTVNLLLFYFNQFSTILISILQFLVLLEVIYYRKSTHR